MLYLSPRGPPLSPPVAFRPAMSTPAPSPPEPSPRGPVGTPRGPSGPATPSSSSRAGAPLPIRINAPAAHGPRSSFTSVQRRAAKQVAHTPTTPNPRRLPSPHPSPFHTSRMPNPGMSSATPLRPRVTGAGATLRAGNTVPRTAYSQPSGIRPTFNPFERRAA